MMAPTRNLILIILMENAMNNLIILEHRVHYIIVLYEMILFGKHDEFIQQIFDWIKHIMKWIGWNFEGLDRDLSVVFVDISTDKTINAKRFLFDRRTAEYIHK